MMNNSRSQPPTTPRNGNGHKVSERGLFSLITFLAAITLLSAALLAGATLILAVLGAGLQNALVGVWYKLLVIGIAYLLGWTVAVVSIRVYGNLILPILINIYTWVCLIAVCVLYIIILQKLFMQNYDTFHYLAYLIIMAGGLGATISLSLIIEDHKLRPFSIPLLIISFAHFFLILYRYVFAPNPQPAYLWNDLFFFVVMLTCSILMLAHWGLLEPVRKSLTNYFDRNSKSIRSKD